MVEKYETAQELLVGGVQGLQLAEAMYARGDVLAQIMAARIAYGAADMFENGAGKLIAETMGLNHPDVTAEDEARVRNMTYEDVLAAAPEAVLAVNGLVDMLGPFARTMLYYVRNETRRRYGQPEVDS